MSDYIKKLLGGEAPTADDWRKHLISAHATAPSMSPSAFGDCLNAEGLNSYEWLALSASRIPSPGLVVDLACGDGYLIPVLQKYLPVSTSFVGIDMSAEELELAQRRRMERTTFHHATADATPFQSGTVSAVFCHMALMLMLPVEPVVAEIHRTLSTGGLFAGVIGRHDEQGGLFSKIQQTVGGFLAKKYPKMSKPVTGDPRVASESGLRDLLSSFKRIQIVDDTFEAALEPEGVWDHIKNMYLIGALPKEAKDDIRSHLNELFEEELRRTRRLVLDFPMRKFEALK